jgi:hypothetical protein
MSLEESIKAADLEHFAKAKLLDLGSVGQIARGLLVPISS